ncbi:MAG: hypothetical protein MI746_02080 [Pseudomonadales bacterium]|nr:hypothetical protein [Pseudomonadales bacterium]
MPSRVSLQIDPLVLQRLLERNALSVNEFSCNDSRAKQQVLKIFGELTANRIRSIRQ